MKIKMLFSAFLVGSSMASMAQSESLYVIPPLAFPQKDIHPAEKITTPQIYAPESPSAAETDEFYKLKSEIEHLKAQEALGGQNPLLTETAKTSTGITPTPTPVATSHNPQTRIPNNEQNPIKNSSTKPSTELKEQDSDLFQNGIMGVIGFLALVGIGGFVLVRIKRRGLLNTIPEKTISISSSLSLSPKRQILVLQVKGREILIANTETGVQFLSDLGGSTESSFSSVASKNSAALLEQRPTQISTSLKSSNVSVSSLSSLDTPRADGEENLTKKSDILLKALKKLNHNQEEDIKIDEPQIQKAAFPKYLANAFEQESKKEIKKEDNSTDTVESVTNLIREKLRSMKPLN